MMNMEKLFLTHYYFPGTDPWKNIMLLPKEEAFRVAAELAAQHPDTASFGRFADFVNYYPLRDEADRFVRETFIQLGGNPKLPHPYCFTLMECEYLRNWFSGGEKIVLELSSLPDDQVSFTLGDSCALLSRKATATVLTKSMLLDQIRKAGSVEDFLKTLPEGYAYVEAQLWDRITG